MYDEPFDLAQYIPSILRISEFNKYAVVVAFQCFVANLTTRTEHFAGAPEVDYLILGGLWNDLSVEEKLAQKDKVLEQLPKI